MKRLAPDSCLACGETLDAVSTANDNHTPMPEAGDFTICIECGHIMAFDCELRLRQLTDAEMQAVAGDKMLLASQRLRAAYNYVKNRK